MKEYDHGSVPRITEEKSLDSNEHTTPNDGTTPNDNVTPAPHTRSITEEGRETSKLTSKCETPTLQNADKYYGDEEDNPNANLIVHDHLKQGGTTDSDFSHSSMSDSSKGTPEGMK